ncbi:TPA: MurR/RpiR family transcriptional regulator [Citrobacter amalonaticus]|uniref:MurR/RpiR family transcriptional regulator n=1 Tax=Citrobacter amalonaticus TaxID=35703 RepID=UPI0008E700E2|nr:MurR/RpiR family transcriptional regulator [Citrobacter amalonaticus]SFB01726.1 DNA-binding transcriptional regulator, MurR/RpiR family, contains HTH and SIS domains [Citrobacter amalonaticus]HAU5595046.1 MurR/RpiR family transcriptional regulator [Citrobacter amalonaticus]HDP8884322.1 MurR/RpiR family transcriptional regulator [Citrobacter amalonaticus]
MNIIEQLQLLVKTGTHAEQTISRYILATLSGAEKLTSTAISKKTQTSQPSIVRFAQSLGYTGFTSFKYDLIKCLRSAPEALLPAQATKNNVILGEFTNNNNPAALNTFFEIINSSRNLYFCHPRELSSLLSNIIQDYSDIGKVCIPVEYQNAHSLLTNTLTDCDSVILLPGLKDEPDNQLITLIREHEAASLAVACHQSGATLADVTLYTPQSSVSPLSFAALKMSLHTLFFHALQYCYLNMNNEKAPHKQ